MDGRKYQRLSQLPSGPRLGLALLYLIALALAVTASVIAIARDFGMGINLAGAFEVVMSIHVLRRA